MQEGFSLQNILRGEETVLFDSSVLNVQGQGIVNFFERFPERVESSLLLRVEGYIMRVLDFVNASNVYTIEDVVEELSALHKLLIRWNSDYYAKHRIKVERGIYREQKLGELYILDSIVSACRRILEGSSVYQPENRDLCRALERFSETCADYSIGERDSRTDERLVALAYYISLFEQRPAAIVTEDAHFLMILETGQRFLAKESVPFDNHLLGRLSKNPIRLYMPKSNRRLYSRIDFPAA